MDNRVRVFLLDLHLIGGSTVSFHGRLYTEIKKEVEVCQKHKSQIKNLLKYRACSFILVEAIPFKGRTVSIYFTVFKDPLISISKYFYTPCSHEVY